MILLSDVLSSLHTWWNTSTEQVLLQLILSSTDIALIYEDLLNLAKT